MSQTVEPSTQIKAFNVRVFCNVFMYVSSVIQTLSANIGCFITNVWQLY